jgi:AAA domain
MNNEIPPGTPGFRHEDKSNLEPAENDYSLDDFFNDGLVEWAKSISSNVANNGIGGAAPSPPVTPQTVPLSHQHVAENFPQLRDTDRETITAAKNGNAAAQEEESNQGQKEKVHPSYVVQDVENAELIEPHQDELGKTRPRLDLSEEQTDNEQQPDHPQVMIEFLKPSAVKAYEPPQGIVLVGDHHIVRDAVFVLAGTPGVGKSRIGVGLGCSGAMGAPWMGYAVHTCFKTMIIQNENGRYRLKLEFSAIDCPPLEDSLLITPPPPFGLCFDRKPFRQQLQVQVETFKPDLVLIDPWNAAARDDRQRDYLETFNDIRIVLPPGTDGPAIGIIAHTRKPQPKERTSGRALLNLLAGSYVLGSIPRCVWVLQSASDDVNEERVVLTCCKNNDGKLGERSVWLRKSGLFVPVSNFDWEAFDHPQDKGKQEPPLDETALAEVFENGNRPLARSEAVETLMSLTGRKRSVCYDALSPKGKFKKCLKTQNGKLVYQP